jgi:hypothetical protein
VLTKVKGLKIATLKPKKRSVTSQFWRLTLGIPAVSDEQVWEYVYKNYHTDFDWYIIVDYSSYVVIPNLKHHLRNFDPSRPFYFGNSISTEEGISADLKSGDN